MGLLTWVLIGLVAGFLAELVLNGGPGGIGLRRLLLTGALGVAGAIVGGYVSAALGFGEVTGFNVRSVVIAAAGAILVSLALRMVTGRRGLA